MKKLFTTLILFVMVGTVQAQGTSSLAWTNSRHTDLSVPWQKQLENVLYQQSLQQKPWQVALFLGTELRPTQETLQTLEEQLRSGTLQRAAVISFTKNNQPVLYVLSAAPQQPVVIQTTLSPDTSAGELFKILLQSLHSTSSLYTALIVNGRSQDGYIVNYGDRKATTFTEIIYQLTHSNLYIDVLDLQVCHLGNALTAYQLASSGRVHYALLSSERRRGSKQHMYYRLLTHLNQPPKEAALTTVNTIPDQFDFSKDLSTHNLFLLDVSQLKIPFKNWIQDPPNYKALQIGWNQLVDFLNIQNTLSSRQLTEALQNAILAQWCYSAPKHQLYRENIPLGSDCINGLAIDREILRLLHTF